MGHQKTAFIPDNLSLEFYEMDFVYIQKESECLLSILCW